MRNCWTEIEQLSVQCLALLDLFEERLRSLYIGILIEIEQLFSTILRFWISYFDKFSIQHFTGLDFVLPFAIIFR